jgi:biopolymer transport protein ExbB
MENEATAAAATPAGDNPYGLEALVQHGDAVSYTVLGILLIMSLVSWYIIFTKLWDQYRLGKSVKAVEKNFWSAGSAREGADRLPKDDDFRVIAESALRAAAHHEGRLGDRISLRDWLGMALQRAVDGLNSKLANGLSFLATVGSTAPFVGLFGTVYGILKALISIGLSGQPSIDKVAGPVGEALIMTAIGLAVAVPAVFGYNILLKRNNAIKDSMREFTGDLESNLIGGLRPDLPATHRTTAAPAAVRK